MIGCNCNASFSAPIISIALFVYKIQLYKTKNLIRKVWLVKTVFPDFLNPKVDVFWKKRLNDYNKLVNYDRIWLDMNETANLI